MREIIAYVFLVEIGLLFFKIDSLKNVGSCYVTLRGW